MKRIPIISKKKIALAITLLFIMLFAYASITKVRDITYFQLQIGQSPLGSAVAGWVAWGIISIEWVTVALLIFQNTRQVGLFLSVMLMSLFTAYILLVLNFSDSIPCSCGGIISGMGWNVHIIFNCACIVFALIGLFLIEGKQTHRSKQ